ncbi:MULTISPECIES: acyltransferase [unclassified Leclercia]|uniref:Acyltransferase n=1 Tax=Leclercia barmai TaxID=2785629 RepID=A0ABS7RTT6_9ENTR|nr:MULTISPECIES: acyltransferase [unclassified Leclercia]MBZ0057730.1 acyltransferase [Leclercia sp. EMC7]MCM5696502.1 acyltransferase [Leclercia sp. LTM01]MCM5700298.1 acyltransferase [Leclercia sp. LTM14]
MKNIKVNGNFSENKIISSGIEALGDNQIKFWNKSSGNIIKFGNSFYCNNLNIVFKGNNNKLIIGDDVKFTGHILIVGSNRTVQIGNGTTAQGVYILSRDADVTIGNNCMFSREIEIRSTDVHKIYDLATGDRLNLAKDIIIGNHVWIAARAIVSKGAIIPDGCVIGASSFVNKAFDIQNCIIAGTPAKVIKENIRWER